MGERCRAVTGLWISSITFDGIADMEGFKRRPLCCIHIVLCKEACPLDSVMEENCNRVDEGSDLKKLTW